MPAYLNNFIFLNFALNVVAIAVRLRLSEKWHLNMCLKVVQAYIVLISVEFLKSGPPCGKVERSQDGEVE